MMAPDVCNVCGGIAAWVETPMPPTPPNILACFDRLGMKRPPAAVPIYTCAPCFGRMPKRVQTLAMATAVLSELARINAELARVRPPGAA